MKLHVGARAIDVDDDDLVGEGGEARVYAFDGMALKLFDKPLRAAKEPKLAAFPTGLPTSVVAPVDVVRDARGAFAGYAMRLVRSAVPFARLADRAGRAAVTTQQVGALLQALARDVAALHARGVAVGDLNDGNVLVARAGGLAPRIIDADSFDLPGFPCAVAHERFLDPRRYGADLAGRLDAATDAYALRVLAFQSLCCLHPFGGTHGSYKTPLRRAEARWSVLRGDVVVPRAALPWTALPDDLLHDFARVFHDDDRRPFDPRLLDARWVLCGCGLVHARARCPVCAVVVAAPRVAPTASGARVVFRVAGTGTIVDAAFDGKLRVLVDDGASLRREDDTPAVQDDARLGLGLHLDGGATWVGLDGAWVRVEQGRATDRLTTRGGAFAASSLGRFVVDGGHLVEAGAGARLGKVVGATTLLAAGPGFGVGLWRAGPLVFPFLFGARGALRDVVLPLPAGRVVEHAASFEGDRALWTIAFADGGCTTYVVDADGRCIAAGAFDARRGALVDGRALVPVPGGVRAWDVDDDAGIFADAGLVPGTGDVVDETTRLVRGAGGAVLAVLAREVIELRLGRMP